MPVEWRISEAVSESITRSLTMMFRALGVANIRLGRIGGEEVCWKRTEVPVPVRVKDGLKATVVELVKKEVLLFGKVAEVVFVRFVQITLIVLHHCVAFECVVRDDGDIIFNECTALILALGFIWGGNSVLGFDWGGDGFVAEADKGVPQAEALVLRLGLAAELDGLRFRFAG